MLLKSMELQGFKTFPDKTKLTFDRGITAVVGPNGSGKSNISDAVRWVLGEQSAKSLRCTKMEDVVFDGTDNRKRQGFAEVTITIDNADRFLPFDGDSVAVTRRYYRSGESEYLINKSAVRLKDVHELFMDTGLGRDGYSMIGQGKIDSIVSSKSEDRREIFEEAAGISRYRYRKTEAERKLEQTEGNLVRLRDIVTGLEERVGPLETQAKKAESFLKYSEEKKGLEIALWLDTLNKSSDVLRENEDKISVTRSQYRSIENELENITRKTEEIYQKNGELASKIDEIRRKSTQWSAEQSEKKSRISVLQNDILHNNQTVGRLKDELERLDASADDAKAQISGKEAQIAALEQQEASLQERYDGTSAELNNITVEAGRSGDEFQQLTQELTKLNAQYADHRVGIVTCDASREELNNRVDSVKSQFQEQSEQLSELREVLADYNTQYKNNYEKCLSLKNTIEGIDIKLESRRKKSEQLKAAADSLMLDAQERTRRAGLLENLEQNLEGFAHSVKAVIQASKKGALRGICGPVSRIIRVPKEYTLAIETALGAAMQYIVTDAEEDAKRAIRFLKERDGGRATFLPVSTIKRRDLTEKGLDDCFGFIGIASNLCESDPEYADILSSLLGRIVIAEDLDSAVAIAKKYGYRFKTVSLDGQVINAGGSLTGGSSGKKSGLLSRASEIEALKKEAAALAEKAENGKKEYLAAQSAFAALEAESLGSKADYNRLLQESVRIDTERKACQNEIANLENAAARLTQELTEAEQKIKSLEEKKAARSLKLDNLSSKISDVEHKIAVVTGSRADLSGRREELSVILQDIRLEVLAVQKDIDNIKNEISAAMETDAQRLNKKQELEREISALNSLNSEISENIKAFEAESQNLEASVKSLEDANADINRQKEELEKNSVELRRTEREKSDERELVSRELARLEERKANLQKQYDDIISKLWEEYELTPRQAEEISVQIENITEAQKRLNSLKQKIKSLGSVNVAAIEEFKEVSERYNFISAQVNDVEKSKTEIEALIYKLTHQMKEAFVISFQEINKNFTQTFRELFDGGTASLSLSEPDNILTSGIDIIVHPPGKIVSHLEALSGGEKALVAIALYFAIMKVRPAPFCVLDEIEAALDDVNIDRFARYMRTMCKQTQFICITHRRGTMEEADVLYGVTMQEKGISKLLELRTAELAAEMGIN